jgi:hypothetical protein
VLDLGTSAIAARVGEWATEGIPGGEVGWAARPQIAAGELRAVEARPMCVGDWTGRGEGLLRWLGAADEGPTFLPFQDW